MNTQMKKMILNKQGEVKTPNPEVSARKTRRRFTAKYKQRVLDQADACKKQGELGEFLRRKGLYSSNLTIWRKPRNEGVLQGITPQKRGRKSVEKNLLAGPLVQLEKENR